MDTQQVGESTIAEKEISSLTLPCSSAAREVDYVSAGSFTLQRATVCPFFSHLRHVMVDRSTLQSAVAWDLNPHLLHGSLCFLSDLDFLGFRSLLA